MLVMPPHEVENPGETGSWQVARSWQCLCDVQQTLPLRAYRNIWFQAAKDGEICNHRRFLETSASDMESRGLGGEEWGSGSLNCPFRKGIGWGITRQVGRIRGGILHRETIEDPVWTEKMMTIIRNKKSRQWERERRRQTDRQTEYGSSARNHRRRNRDSLASDRSSTRHPLKLGCVDTHLCLWGSGELRSTPHDALIA